YANDAAEETNASVTLRQQLEILLRRRGILATKQRMQATDALIVHIAHRVIDLIEERETHRRFIHQFDARATHEWHRQPHVHSERRPNGMRAALEGVRTAVGEAEEFAQWQFD